MCFNFNPGARILRIVTMKFTELIVTDETIRIRPTAPRSNPFSGVYAVLVRGAYNVQPVSGARIKKLNPIAMPLKK
jgi:hypothetical protein